MDSIHQIGYSGDSLRRSFGNALIDLAPTYEFFVLDADVAGGTCTDIFRSAYPARYLNCGIAEQNMMGMAAGINLAIGVPVFVTGFATFLMRAWEIARISVAYNRANVKIVSSHLGLDVGPDGASAQSLEDIACWRAMPNMAVIAPCDPSEVYSATKAILEYSGPVYMRTGRSPIEGRVYLNGCAFEIGKGSVVHRGKHSRLALVGHGTAVYRCLNAAYILAEKHRKASTVVNMSTIKPLDEELLLSLARTHSKFVVVEDHSKFGGLYSAICELFAKQERRRKVLSVAVEDCFGESGEPNELNVKFGISTKDIVRTSLDD